MAGKGVGMVVLSLACSSFLHTSGTPVLSPSTTPLVLHRYGTLNLTCKSDGPTTWHRDTVKMDITRRNGFVQTAETYRTNYGTTTISKLWKVGVDLDDSGIYSCQDDIIPRLQALIDVRVHNGENPVITPDQSPIWVLAPGAINLTCVADGDTSITWRKEGTPLSGSDSKYNITVKKQGTNGDFETTSMLTVLNPTAADAGQYDCEPLGVAPITKLVKVLQVTVTNANYTFGQDVELRCDPLNIILNTDGAKHFTWNKNNAPLASDRYTEDTKNYTLVIKSLVRADVGQYECVFSFDVTTAIQKLVQPVHLYASPFVQKFDRSKNMVQGDTLKLKCLVSGHPAPVIVWRRDGVEIDPESDERINIKDLMEGETVKSKEGLLTIFDLNFEDRAEYQCEANNTFGSDSSVILVRVKDKLAALWPFLGIVAEVIILCTIIFIYEKRRSKDTEDEEDAPLQKTSMANAQDHKGKEEVRQRKP